MSNPYGENPYEPPILAELADERPADNSGGWSLAILFVLAHCLIVAIVVLFYWLTLR